MEESQRVINDLLKQIATTDGDIFIKIEDTPYFLLWFLDKPLQEPNLSDPDLRFAGRKLIIKS
ncbi:MAG: hypothetical protein WAW92_04785 [Minisyncoccia bacterium]